MAESFRAARRAAAELEPGVLRGEDALLTLDLLRATGHAIAAALARVAARVAETGAYRTKGYDDAADYLSRSTGWGIGAAQRVLRAMEGIDDCPETRDALIKGELSLDQAHEIVLTATNVKGSEPEMLSSARHESLHKLRERGRERRCRAMHPDDLGRQREEAKRFRHGVDAMGMVTFSGALPPEVGTPFVKRVDVETDRIYREYAREGEPKSRERCAAEAFARIIAEGGKPHATRAELVIVAGVHTMRTGTVHAGEPCHVLSDSGPIPVSPGVARHMLEEDDVFVKLVLHDGVDITNVSHVGRKRPAELMTAVEIGHPPDFHGRECGDGCGRRMGLENDHIDPVANGGLTSLDNLEPKCRPSHTAKTERDREAGLLNHRSERAPPDESAA